MDWSIKHLSDDQMGINTTSDLNVWTGLRFSRVTIEIPELRSSFPYFSSIVNCPEKYDCTASKYIK